MSENNICRVMVVEDEPLILENTISKIENITPYFKVVGKAFNGQEALSIIDSVKPNLLFTDVRMPIMDGLVLIKHIREKYPDIRIVIFSGYNEFEYAQQAIKFGVKDYLLKPLSIGSLSETLKKIRLEFEAEAETSEKSLLISLLNSLQTDEIKLSTFNKSYFIIFLICIGNICDESTSEKMPYRAIVENIYWDSIIKTTLGNTGKWWVFDERLYNEKFIIIAPQDSLNINVLEIAEILKSALSTCTNSLSVTICTEDAPIPISDIGNASIRLRLRLNQRLVLGKSSVILSSKTNSTLFPIPSVSQKTENAINIAIQNGNKYFLNNEIQNLFKQWEENQYPQKWIEKALQQLIKILQRKFIQLLPEYKIYNLESELYTNLYVSSSLKEYFEFFWNTFESLLFVTNDYKDTSKEFIRSIEEYIKNNFREQINLEYIAKKFNFDPSYLTRTFKKYNGSAPLKYITKLRIEEAKWLISNKSELDLKEVSEMVGYQDQHYFSRIFKNVTGKSPSEYKNN